MSLELPRMLVLPTQSCIVLGRISPRDKVQDRDYTNDSNKLSVCLICNSIPKMSEILLLSIVTLT